MHWRQSPVFLKVLTLASGIAVAQVVTILAAPVLTRFYSPADFGAFSVFAALGGILTTVATGRYEQAIMLPEEEQVANNLAWLAILITLAFSLSLLPIGWFCSDLFSSWFKAQALDTWWLLLPLLVLLLASIQVLTAWSNRSERYRQMAVARLAQTGVSVSGQVTLGVVGLGAAGLMIGYFVGLLAGFLALLRHNYSALRWPAGASLREVAGRYKDFPTFLIFTAFIDTTTSQLPLVLVGYLFGQEAAGQYSLSQRVLMLPVSIVGGAIAQVYYKKIAKNPESFYSSFFHVWIIIGGLGLMPCIVAIYFSEDIFILLFGMRWNIAGQVTSISAPVALLFLLSTSTSSMILVFGLQRITIFFAIQVLVTRFFSLYLTSSLGLIKSILVYSVIEFFSIVAHNLICLKLIRDRLIKRVVYV